MIHTTQDLGVLLPVNMGNRGHNVLDVRETFQRLNSASQCARFISFHPRISGNVVFEGLRDEVITEALRIGQDVTGLRCLARRFSELKRVDQRMPKGESLPKGDPWSSTSRQVCDE